MIALRAAVLPFLIGVILTSIIFILMRPEGASRFSLSPSSSESPTPQSSEDAAAATMKERDRCQTMLGLFHIPLLDPPDFLASMPERLQTNHEGEVQVKWKSVPQAQSYYVSVTDESGNPVRTYRSTSAGLYLKGLPKPNKKEREKYLVKIASVNANEIVGKFSAPRELFVLRPLDLTAPRIKEIRVED